MSTSDYFSTGWAGHVHESLSEYLDGGLSAAERAEVEAHLASCPRCRADLASLRLTVQLVRQLPLQPIPRSFVLPVPRRAPAIVTWLRVSTGALAAVFVALLAIQLTSSPARSPAAAPQAAQSAARVQSTVARNAAVAAPTTAPAAAAPRPAAAVAGSAANGAGAGSSPGPAELTPAGPSRDVPALALAPTPTAYPIPATVPTVVPLAPADQSYPYPNAPQPPVPAPTFAPYPSPGQPAAAGQAVAPTPTPAAPITLTGGPNWLTPGIVLVAVLLVLSGALLLLLSRRH